MKTLCRALLALSITLGFLAAPAALAKDPTEDELLAKMDVKDEGDVVSALQAYEKKLPDSEKLKAKAISLLGDERPKVRRKAARVLGVLHVKLDEKQMAQVIKLLSGSDKAEVIDGLKALRDFEYKPAVPAIVPLLQNPDDNIKRDSCRTLAVIADASVIPQIEPLLNDKEKKVKEDAQAAIAQLKNK